MSDLSTFFVKSVVYDTVHLINANHHLYIFDIQSKSIRLSDSITYCLCKTRLQIYNAFKKRSRSVKYFWYSFNTHERIIRKDHVNDIVYVLFKEDCLDDMFHFTSRTTVTWDFQRVPFKNRLSSFRYFRYALMAHRLSTYYFLGIISDLMCFILSYILVI